MEMTEKERTEILNHIKKLELLGGREEVIEWHRKNLAMTPRQRRQRAMQWGVTL